LQAAAGKERRRFEEAESAPGALGIAGGREALSERGLIEQAKARRFGIGARLASALVV